jgi:hypothetical protein
VARKLRMIQEQRQDQSSFFEQEITETKAETPKTVLGLNSGEDCFCSSETKQDRRTAPRPKLLASERRLHKQRPEP